MRAEVYDLLSSHDPTRHYNRGTNLFLFHLNRCSNKVIFSFKKRSIFNKSESIFLFCSGHESFARLIICVILDFIFLLLPLRRFTLSNK